MIGNKLEKEIIGIFNRDITAFLSINQISKELGKAYPYINIKVNELIDEGILNKAEIGRSYQCSINLKNEKAVALLTLNEVEKKQKALKKIKNSEMLEAEIDKIRAEFKIYTILLSGKDILFVLDYIHDKEAIKNLYHEIKKFNLMFFEKQDFKRYAVENSVIMKKSVILYSYEKYFELLRGVKNSLIMAKVTQ